MTDYSDLVRCLRDCSGDVTDTDYTCDCDNCLMKDKIVEHTDEDGETYFADYTECESALALAAADAIEELEFACNRHEKDYKALCAYLPKWIPVSDEYPKEFHDVLCYTDAYDMFIATYYGLDRDGEPVFDDNNGDYWDGNVIYWMPLPARPEEETE